MLILDRDLPLYIRLRSDRKYKLAMMSHVKNLFHVLKKNIVWLLHYPYLIILLLYDKKQIQFYFSLVCL